MKMKNMNGTRENGMKIAVSRAIAFGAAAALLLMSGCKTEEDYKKERIAKAQEQFESVRKRDLPADKVLTLHDCIKLAMEHNMDIKIQNMEKDAATNMLWAEILGMLPDLTVTNNFTTRSNQPGSSSKAVEQGGETYDYSTSQDKNINNLSVDLAFSLLDFGLAFFNSQQGHDRVLMKQRQIERLRQNLTLDVVRAYFKVAAAQRAVDITNNLLLQCRNHSEVIDRLEKKKMITPFRAFEEKNRLLTMEKRLTNYTRVYENSCVELRALLGVYPSVNIIVDDTILDKDPVMELPEIELLEQMAILKRPELYEIDIQRHINILECRKTLLMMLPNVQVYMDLVNNNNSFLYYQTWWELAIRAAYNALKTPQHLARYMAYSDQADIEKVRSFAQAITVMSQVRIAKADIASSRQKYELNRRENRNYSEHLKKEQSKKAVRGTVSELELDHLRMAVAETEIERLLALGACHISYYRLLNSIGVENLDPATQEALKKELEAGARRAEKELARARAEYEKKQAEAENARIARLLFDEGMKKQSGNQLLAASEYYRRAAQKGNASAMFCLGKLYWSGKGVKQDYAEAVRWFKAAAEGGNVEAMVVLGWVYYRGLGDGKIVAVDLKRSRKYYQLAVDNGDDRAYYWLGAVCYELKDYETAMASFKKAARIRPDSALFIDKSSSEQKSIRNSRALAMVRVGCMYREGTGGEGVNYAKAKDWFEQAAKLGDPSAMNNLSMMYAVGDGVQKDPALSEEWFKKYQEAAAKQ
ncbi:MAG: hypothetical protein E7055_07820 [Lentisphaerae bacterium]|nr:hypothetical protein [Lentisphaerota bacterium]